MKRSLIFWKARKGGCTLRLSTLPGKDWAHPGGVPSKPRRCPLGSRCPADEWDSCALWKETQVLSSRIDITRSKWLRGERVPWGVSVCFGTWGTRPGLENTATFKLCSWPWVSYWTSELHVMGITLLGKLLNAYKVHCFWFSQPELNKL